jgi:DNA-binding GntR family transcriptional regulator
MSLPAVPRRLLRDEAYRVLRDAIVGGVLAPGEQLRDGELAERVGLSRTPVREALARLTDEGLVESKPHAYTRVTALDRRECRDAYVVVRALQELAVREAVPRLAPADLAAMRAANTRFAAALDAGDVDAALRSDDDFHGALTQASGNRALILAIERLLPQIRRLERLRFGSLPGRRSVRDHEEITAACEAGDVERAVALTSSNWATLGQLIDQAFNEEDQP